MNLDMLRLCVERLGYVDGAKVAQFCTEWLIAEKEVGPEMGIVEFAEWWKDASTRTAYYRLERFRQGFPELGERAYPRDAFRVAARSGERAPKAGKWAAAGTGSGAR